MTRKKPHIHTAKVTHRTLSRLVTLAARFAETDDHAMPVFKQVRFANVGGRLEARATDRYTLAFVTADLMNGQTWPAGLDLGLTVRQWRTILATLRPARGRGHLDDLRTFTVDDKARTVTVSREPEALGDTVNSLTFPIPDGELPNLDKMRTIDPDKVEPLPYVAIDGRHLAKLPREYGLIVAERGTGPAGVDPAAARPVHVLAYDWHAVIMSARLADQWSEVQPAAHVPAQWAKPATTTKEPA